MENAEIALLAIAGLLFFCLLLALSQKEPKEEQRYPDLKNAVVFFFHECGNITWKEKGKDRSIALSPGKALSQKLLQKEIASRVEKTPINTKLRITNFAWELLAPLTEADVLPANWEPIGAYHFCNNIVMIRYKEKPPKKGPANQAIKDLYFNTGDGHLIHMISKS